MAVIKANKIFRQSKAKAVEAPDRIANNTYNEAAGAQKNVSVGPHLKAIFAGGVYTVNAAAILGVGEGTALAVFNSNTTTVRSITVRASAAGTALAAGAVDATNGEVGVACAPLEWTYLNTYDKNFVITNSAELFVYVIHDDTYITNQRQAGA